MDTELYLDSNATTSVIPAARAAVLQSLTDTYGNPSSSHSAGLRARALMNEARARACRMLGVGDGRLMFNSGATEGIQTAVLSALCAVRERREAGLPCGSLLVYGATEHKAVPESLAHWNRILRLNLELRRLPVDRDGQHDLAVLRELAPHSALVCTMAANNETGTISNLDGIAAALNDSPALWLVDCVQALGKLPLNLAATRIDYAPFSGHKLYAPKGIGMLYVRAGAPFTPLLAGGGQESGLRAGTENMAGIAAMNAVLAELETGSIFRSNDALEAVRTKLVDSLSKNFPGIVFNTPLDKSLPTTLNVAIPGVSSSRMLDVLDAAGLRVSAGSACSAAKSQPSYVLDAMGLPDWCSSNAVRISFGPATDDAFIDEVCHRLDRCSEALRRGAAEDASSISGSGNEYGVLSLELPTAQASSEAARDMHLDTSTLHVMLRDQPETMVVDVREPYEFHASTREGLLENAVNIPLTKLVRALPEWLGRQTQTPIVFYCRSGNRSERAAQSLRSLGYGAAYHLAGGLALADIAQLGKSATR